MFAIIVEPHMFFLVNIRLKYHFVRSKMSEGFAANTDEKYHIQLLLKF